MLAQDFVIGEEVVEPLYYPKFTVAGEYGLNRKFHGFADPKLRAELDRVFEVTLSFEAGLAKYFNAGGLYGLSIHGLSKPIHMRFGLFAKPQIPLGSRFAVYSRIAAGLAVDLAFFPTANEYYGWFDKERNYERVFRGQKYNALPFGGFGSAALGFEVFPFTRFGLALEWGIRASLLHGRRSAPFLPQVPNKANAPSSFNYMLYSFPVSLSLHFII